GAHHMCEWVDHLALPAPEPCWHGVEEGHARGLAAAAINTPRGIDPAHCREWRLHSTDYVARVTQALQDCPQQGWLDDGDAEYREYLAVDPGVGWRLPRLVARLHEAWQLELGFAGQLERAKLDALKELAYGASHEINNPLANISGR